VLEARFGGDDRAHHHGYQQRANVH